MSELIKQKKFGLYNVKLQMSLYLVQHRRKDLHKTASPLRTLFKLLKRKAMTQMATNPATLAQPNGQLPAGAAHPDADSQDTERGEPPRLKDQKPTMRKWPGSITRLRAHLNEDVSTSHADILMLTCCLVSGLVDSTIYNAYGTFVSMQTGNTIFLGLGGATPLHRPPNPKPYGWAKSLTSLSCFFLGCWFFSHFSRHFGPLRRSTLAFSFLIQSILVFIAGAIVQAGVVDGDLDTISSDIAWKSEIPIALLSFQSAGQIIGSRVLNLSEIPSVVLTSMLCDLASDPQLVGGWKSNIKRNRRALAFAMILVGAVAGGFISEGSGKMQVVLWIAGALKVLITGAWMLWPKSKASIV